MKSCSQDTVVLKKKKAKLLDQSLLGLFVKLDDLCLNYVLMFELKHHYAQLVSP